ncbi:MAG TPA: tail fiber domain-containing protein, partial [Candidatus Paceibacterota bacterium]
LDLANSNTWTANQIFNYSSTTYASLSTASTTNLILNGSSFNNLLGTGLTLSSGALTVGTLNQNTTGSAATLTTSRNINGVAFNGSADITVTAAAGTLSGATLASGVTASSLTSVGTLTTLTVSGNITASNVAPNSLVSTNASGVLIGTSTPTFGIFAATTTNATSTIAGALTIGNSNFTVNTDGKVGIGTTTPGSLLSIGNTGGINFTTATSSFSTTGGINMASGCFAIAGTCVSGGGSGSGTVNTGTTGQFPYYAANGTTLTATSSLFLATSANVGIGTTTPTSLLSLSGSIPRISLFDSDTALSATNPQFAIRSFGGGNSYFSIQTSPDFTTFTDRLVVDSVGNVGIGTTSPYANLTIYKAGSTAANSPQLVLSASTTASGVGSFISNWAVGTDNADGGKFKISSSSVIGTNDRFVIDGSGNVGIGTTGPASKLDVSADASTDIRIVASGTGATPTLSTYAARGTRASPTATLSGDSLGGIYMFGYDSGGSVYRYQGVIETIAAQDFTSNNVTGGHIRFLTRGTGSGADPTEYMRITSAGNLGIGTTTPQYQLTVASSTPMIGLYDSNAAANTKNWFVGNFDGTFAIGTSTDTDLINATSTAFSISAPTTASPGTTVGIATTSPWRTLSVTGTVGFDGLTSATTGNYVCINTTTKEITSGTTCTLSSERYKTEIATLDDAGLDTVLALRPVSFRFKSGFGDNGSAKQLGFIAEEAVKIDPRLVPLDENGLPNGFFYQNYTAVLTNAIQELHLDITATSTLLEDGQPTLVGRVLSFLQSMGVEITKTYTRITSLFIGDVHVENKLCVDDVCVDKGQLKALLIQAGGSSGNTDSASDSSGSGNGGQESSGGGSGSSSQENSAGSSGNGANSIATTTEPVDTSLPVITILGNNPATIDVGSSYADLGATVTDTNADGSVNNNLGIHFSVDDVSVQDISIDTSTTSTHTILYSATDGAGNTGTATRSVVVQ